MKAIENELFEGNDQDIGKEEMEEPDLFSIEGEFPT